MKRLNGQKILIVAIVLLLLGSAGAVLWINARLSDLTVVDDNSEPDYSYHFAMVVENNENPYWNLVYEGAREKAAEAGVVLEMTGSAISESYSLSDKLQMAAVSKADGIFVASDGAKATGEIIMNTTSNLGIPVISMMENDATNGRSGYVGINSYEQGIAYGSIIKELSAEQGVKNVVLLSSGGRAGLEDTDYSTDLIYSSLIEYINTHEMSDKVSVTIYPVNNASIFNSKRDIQILISEGTPDVVICTDYLLTMNTCQAVVDKNMVGKIKILGSYLSKEILDYIQKGTMYATVAVDPYELGEVCINGMVELMEMGRTNDYLPIEMMIINRGNVGRYKSIYVKEGE